MNRIWRGDGVVGCRHVRAHLTAYQYNALSPRQKAVIARHLDQCDDCRQRLSDGQNLEQELRWEAIRGRAVLTPAASARIQEAVYRRMRRALFLQRTWRLAGQFASLSITLLLMITVFFFARQVPGYTGGDVTAESPASGLEVEQAPTVVPVPDAVIMPASTRAPIIPTPPIRHGLELPPDDLAAVVVQAALDGNNALLTRIYGNASHREAIVRVWDNITRCGSELAANDLAYEVYPRSRPGLVRVDLLKDGRNVGELKMRFQEGEWRIFFTRYPNTYALGGCNQRNNH
ncbi:MAG: zf-HC2 domain-containing protein [Anaerolineales bacterium]|nr:zf-HC2 domain-containing protein [Anaerolineales bacterium]MCB8953464.1 zf-HC2 domain-containing protein [Ardenticatenales bacterium]